MIEAYDTFADSASTNALKIVLSGRPRALDVILRDGTNAWPDGCVAVDARVRVRRVEAATRMKTW